MKTNKILFLFIVCFLVLSINIKAQVNAAPLPNGIEDFYFNKTDSAISKMSFIFSTPIVQLESTVQQSQFHFDLLKVTTQNRYYQSSLDKMICITPNKPINDKLNAMPLFKIQDLSPMPNVFPKSEMITIK